jgi:hypothetical protein
MWYAHAMKQMKYTFWVAKEGGFIGYLNQYPDYWTEGETREELEMMLASLYGDMREMGLTDAPEMHSGVVRVPA